MSSKRWLKCSVKSVSSVRENIPTEVNSKLKKISELCVLCERKIFAYNSPLISFPQMNTDKQNTQG